MWLITLVVICLLLARGRDRLETISSIRSSSNEVEISYSLGDAIDWKLFLSLISICIFSLSYSLGDAIDWKHEKDIDPLFGPLDFLLLARGRDRLETPVLMSLFNSWKPCLLLARGRDRLETRAANLLFRELIALFSLLLARGRDRLETELSNRNKNALRCVLLLARGRDRLETFLD